MPCLVNASRASLKQSASWLNWPLCGVLVIRDHASIAAYTLLVVFFCTILQLVVVFVTQAYNAQKNARISPFCQA